MTKKLDYEQLVGTIVRAFDEGNAISPNTRTAAATAFRCVIREIDKVPFEQIARLRRGCDRYLMYMDDELAAISGDFMEMTEAKAPVAG